MKRKVSLSLIWMAVVSMVCTTMINGQVFHITAAEEANQNLALQKATTVSGLEVSDGRWTADKAVDGIVSNDSRVSLAKDKDEQWMVVDLGEEKTFSYVRINYESQVPQYKVQVSNDGINFRDVFEELNGGNQASGTVNCSFEPVQARYVRYVQMKRWKHSGNGKYYSGSIYEFEVYENDPDAVVENVNLALNKPASASSLEVTDGRFTAAMAVDGIVSKESRVSFGKGSDEQWLLIDLEEAKTMSYVVLNYESQVEHYKLQVSDDGINFKDVYERSDAPSKESGIQKITFEPVQARYLRYVQMKRWYNSGNKTWYSGSLYELEVYAKEPQGADNAQDALDAVKDEVPEIAKDGQSIILPAVAEGYEISLYGSDNQQVITKEGQLIQPLIDMSVHIMYQVVNKEDAQDIATSESDITMMVPGKHTPAPSENAKPNVVPGLREWIGGAGDFQLTNTSRITYQNEELAETANMIQYYLQEMCNLDLSVVKEEAQSGDIELILNQDQTLGKEGYDLIIEDKITIRSPECKGVLYGGISVTQIASQSVSKAALPKGSARDYPKYEVRAGMIDVGRMYIPLDYLQEISTVMAWYKLNEVQVHVNDYWGASGYSAFRLESDVYPMIMASDGTYSKQDYKQYQIDMKKYGIDVITEIDTPYHAECFKDVPGVKMLKAGSLDIREESSYTIIENIMSEYLDGDDPVIQSNKFHIGTDEYDKAYSEQMRKYTDHFINFVNNKGYETRLWGSLGSRGFNGSTPVSTDATINLWAPYWADVKETYADGWNVINTCGGWLYIVPGGNAGYPDRMDLKALYNTFDVNNFAPSRNYGQGTAIMPFAHPQTKGASFALWNDVTTFRGGFSEFDIYDRVKDAIAITSEKTWYGEQTTGQSADEFLKRVDQVEGKVPGANPAREVDSKTPLVAAYDFVDEASDYSGNGYDGIISNGTIVDVDGENALTLQGDGYLSLPFTSLGYPYTVYMDVYLNENTDQTTLFSGNDGIFYTNINGSGKAGFSRSGYDFSFDYRFPTNQWVSIAITSDAKTTTLYVDGKGIAATNMESSTRKDSTSSVLPVEKIGASMKGSIKNLELYNEIRKSDQTKIAHGNMIASATSSLNADRTPDKAIDDVESTSWSADFNKETLPQSITLAFDKAYRINRYEYFPKRTYADGQITKYCLETSMDGVNYQEVASGNWEENFDLKTVTFEPTEARYVRLTALAGKNNQAAAGELNVYQVGPDTTSLKALITTANLIVKNDADRYSEASIQQLKDAILVARNVVKTAASQEELDTALQELQHAIDALVSSTSLEEVLLQINDLEQATYTTSSWKQLQEKVQEANALLEKEDVTQDQLNAMIQVLHTMMAALDVKASTEQCEILQKAVQDALDMESAYTPESYAPLKAAALEAKALLDTAYDDISAQAIMDAIFKIAYAKENLETGAMKAALQATLHAAAAILNSDEIENARPGKVEALRIAVAAAEDLLKQEDVSNEQYQTMMISLQKAMQELYTIVDKTKLANVITEVRTLNEAQYTSESWDALMKSIQEAEALLQNDNATREAVEQCYDKVVAAIVHLQLRSDKTALADAIKMAQTILANDKQYIPSTIIGLDTVCKKALAVYEDETATMQEIKSMTEELIKENAKARCKADKHVLLEKIKMMSAMDLQVYKAGTEEMKAALQQAQKIAEKEDATQEEVQQMIELLDRASRGLQLKDATKDPEKQQEGQIQKTPSASTADTTQMMAWMFLFLASGCYLLMKKKKHS